MSRETVPLIEHLAKLREADERFDAERDRRHTEINVEKEKATLLLAKKDEEALQLAREIQAYKDEKANELRSQIESERGSYITRSDQKVVEDKLAVLEGERREYITRYDHQVLEDKLVAMIKPVSDYVVAQQGKTTGVNAVVYLGFAVIAAVTAIITAVVLATR